MFWEKRSRILECSVLSPRPVGGLVELKRRRGCTCDQRPSGLRSSCGYTDSLVVSYARVPQLDTHGQARSLEFSRASNKLVID